MARKPLADSIDVPEVDTPAESAPPETPSEPVTPVQSRRRVAAYDAVTGEKLPHLVPPSHLDGRFPNIRETPSSKVGK